jgi:hypothetical protein
MWLRHDLGPAQLKRLLTRLGLGYVAEDVIELDVMLVSEQRHVREHR